MTCGAHRTWEFALETVRIRITYILERLENLEETAMPRTKLCLNSTPFPRIWVLLSSKLQGGNSSFTCVLFTALKTRVFQRQTVSSTGAVKDTAHWIWLLAGPMAQAQEVRNSLPEGKLLLPACPAVFSLQRCPELEPCFCRKI